MIASPGQVIWINGEPADVRDLAPGDTVEFEGGPVLRFRFDPRRQLVREQQRVSGLAELLRKLEGQTLRRGDLDALREELSRGLVDTGERVRALEAGSAAASQVIARSSGSVAFMRGSFGFEDPATKRPLRFAVTKKGGPMLNPNGRPLVTLEGGGPLVKVRFTGTAFVVNREACC